MERYEILCSGCDQGNESEKLNSAGLKRLKNEKI